MTNKYESLLGKCPKYYTLHKSYIDLDATEISEVISQLIEDSHPIEGKAILLNMGYYYADFYIIGYRKMSDLELQLEKQREAAKKEIEKRNKKKLEEKELAELHRLKTKYKDVYLG